MKYIFGLIIFIFVFQSCTFSKEQHPVDTLRYSIDLHSVTPKQFFSVLKYDSDTAQGVKYITVSWDAPKDWVQLDDVKYFMQYIDSTEKCKCIITVISSYLPFDDYSTLGGQAMNLIDSYRKNQPYFQSSWDCSKNDSLRAQEIKEWWESMNIK
ncbi:MAG: hypothetical protein M0Q51_13060 [Bacteroidales bacterium]|nr:hypothetical protein [Bacteroidales bacterium]